MGPNALFLLWWTGKLVVAEIEDFRTLVDCLYLDADNYYDLLKQTTTGSMLAVKIRDATTERFRLEIQNEILRRYHDARGS